MTAKLESPILQLKQKTESLDETEVIPAFHFLQTLPVFNGYFGIYVQVFDNCRLS